MYRLVIILSPEVLIIPYGIEIKNIEVTQPIHYVLIIPYGIEIISLNDLSLSLRVLIIPYGIEIQFPNLMGKDPIAF